QFLRIGPRFPGKHLGIQLALPEDFELLSPEVFDCARIVLAPGLVNSYWRLEAVLHKGGPMAWIEPEPRRAFTCRSEAPWTYRWSPRAALPWDPLGYTSRYDSGSRPCRVGL